jgi:hypothetical protein
MPTQPTRVSDRQRRCQRAHAGLAKAAPLMLRAYRELLTQHRGLVKDVRRLLTILRRAGLAQ